MSLVTLTTRRLTFLTKAREGSMESSSRGGEEENNNMREWATVKNSEDERRRSVQARQRFGLY